MGIDQKDGGWLDGVDEAGLVSLSLCPSRSLTLVFLLQPLGSIQARPLVGHPRLARWRRLESNEGERREPSRAGVVRNACGGATGRRCIASSARAPTTIDAVPGRYLSLFLPGPPDADTFHGQPLPWTGETQAPPRTRRHPPARLAFSSGLHDKRQKRIHAHQSIASPARLLAAGGR